MKKTVTALVTFAGALAMGGVTSQAQEYRPGFSCPRPDGSDALTVAICADPAMAKAELMLEKAYYLLREFEGPAAYQDLKTKAAAIDRQTRETCRISPAGIAGKLPADVAACYIAQTTKRATDWAASAYGPAYNEARRDIDTHLSAQKKLASVGYLDPAKVDGVYGDDTRDAIIAWQRERGVLATGFLSDLQVHQLLSTASNARPVTAADSIDKLQAVLTSAMLNVRVPYLEALLGPAVQVSTLSERREARNYRVAGCELTAYASAGVVYGYGLDVNRACRPDFSDILGGLPTRSWPMTFGSFTQHFDMSNVQATCLSSCGNAVVPIILSRYQGSHAESFTNLQLSTTLASDQTIAASIVWQNAMRGRGQDYVISGRFNCDTSTQAVAHKALAEVRVTHIFIGTGQDDTADEIDRSCAPARGKLAR